MKTFWFFLLIAAIIVVCLYFKYWRSDPDIEFENRATQWDSILTGNLGYNEYDSSAQEIWQITGNIEFFGDHEFRLNATEEFYNLTGFGRTLVHHVGGGVAGRWYGLNDSVFLLQGRECDFQWIKEGFKENKRKLDCDVFSKGIEYGSVSNLKNKTTITGMNSDFIDISGRSYHGGYDILIRFYRGN